MSTRKFKSDPDYSTKNSDRFGERSLYIVKCDEDFDYTEAYLSPEFLREYSIGRGFEVEPLRSPGGTQALLLEQRGSYYLLLAYQREAVFMMRVDDLDDTDRILGIVSRSYLALRKLSGYPPGYQLLLDFDKVDIPGTGLVTLQFSSVDIWGNETTDQWSFHSIGDQGYIIGAKEGKFVDMMHLTGWLRFLVKKYTSGLATCGGNPLSGSPPAVEI